MGLTFSLCTMELNPQLLQALLQLHQASCCLEEKVLGHTSCCRQVTGTLAAVCSSSTQMKGVAGLDPHLPDIRPQKWMDAACCRVARPAGTAQRTGQARI